MVSVTPYGSLVGVNVRGQAFVEVLKTQLHQLLRPLIRAIEVDEDWYVATYADVAEAIRHGTISSGTEHYRQAGYFEDRMPRRIDVDERWYRSAYPDVDRAINERQVETAQQHFETDGFREGRLPSEGWRL